MAQWLGQLSGHTHASRVVEAEATLRRAIAAFLNARAEERERKAKSVRRLAERLLTARLKLLNATIVALQSPAADRVGNADGIESLIRREARTRSEGVRGILVEFEVQDAEE